MTTFSLDEAYGKPQAAQKAAPMPKGGPLTFSLEDVYQNEFGVSPDLLDPRSVLETSGVSQLGAIRNQVMNGVPLKQAVASQPSIAPPPMNQPAQAAPMTPAAQDRASLANVIGSGLSGFNTRLAGLPGDLVDASSWFSRNTIAPAIDAIAGTNYADQIARQPSVGDAMRSAASNVIPITKPASRTAEYAQAFGQGAADASTVALGGAAVSGGKGLLGATGRFLAPRTGRDIVTTLTSGGGAASGAMAGGDVGQELGGDRGRMYGELVGGISGGLLGGVIPDRLLTSAAKPKPRTPTNEQLREQADALYTKAEQSGVVIKGDAVKELTDKIRNDLAEFGYDPINQPNIQPVLDRLDKAVETGNITLKGLDIIRRVANRAVDPANPSQTEALGNVIASIDDFALKLPAQAVTAGDSGSAVNALRQARDVWRRVKKSEQIDRALLKAEDRAASTNSGGNEDNAIRQNLRQILDNPKLSRGFTKAELADIRRVVRGGGMGQQAVRVLGKMSPQGSGLMAALGTYGSLATMNPLMAIPGAVGLIAKPIADGMTRRAFNRLSDNIRSGSRVNPSQGLFSPPQIPRPVATGLLSQLGPQAGNQMAQGFAGGDTLDKVAMGLSPIPGVGDVASVANDARNFASGKTPMTAANLGMAALGALPFVPGMAGAVGKTAAKADEGITAYHGSPNSFDKFDMAKMGSGEGDQFFGKGLYFADQERFAKDYKGPNYKVTVDGKPYVNANVSDATKRQVATDLLRRSRPELIERYKDQLQTAQAGMVDNSLTPAQRAEWRGEYKATQAKLNAAFSEDIATSPSTGSMYQVKINADRRSLPDFEDEISRHPKAARAIANEMMKAKAGAFVPTDSIGDAYQKLETAIGAEKARKLMLKNGINGFTAIEDTGKASISGKQYVIFDDKLIDILKRYGIPITVGAGGSAMVMGANMPEAMAAQLSGKDNEAQRRQTQPPRGLLTMERN